MTIYAKWLTFSRLLLQTENETFAGLNAALAILQKYHSMLREKYVVIFVKMLASA